MRDFGDRSKLPAAASSPPRRKRLGSYLVDAGLLTPAQIDVALNDQKLTGMRFGEILAARGWVKQQTIEYLMQKVILPEQKAIDNEYARKQAAPPQALQACGSDGVNGSSQASKSIAAQRASLEEQQRHGRRDIPAAKPVPPATPGDDVSWVG